MISRECFASLPCRPTSSRLATFSALQTPSLLTSKASSCTVREPPSRLSNPLAGSAEIGLSPASAVVTAVACLSIERRQALSERRLRPRKMAAAQRFLALPQKATTGDMEDATKQNSRRSLLVGITFWYVVNVYFSIFSKQSLSLFPHAWTVSVVQLLIVVACSAVGWVSGMMQWPFKSMSPDLLRWLLPAALSHAIGNGLTAVALSWGSVSFMHVVKTSEPIWMAVGIFLVNGTRLPRGQVLAVLPIVFGVALASAGEISFTWLGFLAAIGSTVAFAARGIFTKGLMSVSTPDGQKVSPLNAFALDSLLALAFTLPVAMLLDGPLPLQGVQPGVAGLIGLAGLAYYVYNAFAFQLLGMLDVVSWAVVNLGKRIVVIGWSVIALNTPLTMRAILGSMTAIAGSGLYSYIKAKS